MRPEHVSTQVSGYYLAHLWICLPIAKVISSSLFWVGTNKIYWGLEILLGQTHGRQEYYSSSIKIVIWELETHSFMWVCFSFLMHPGLLNMYLVMIIFCESCLSSVCIQDFNVHSGMDMLLRFLHVFPYAFKTSVCDRLRYFLDMNPSMSRLRWFYYCMNVRFKFPGSYTLAKMDLKTNPNKSDGSKCLHG